MENYERKYKKALEWMQSLYSGLHGTTKEEAEKYFPELKESKDDRIVRCLLNYFNHVHYNGIDLKGTDIDEVIAWLEEQSKQKFVEWSKEDEVIILQIKQIMNCASLLNLVPDKLDKINKWLKSLKQRIKK